MASTGDVASIRRRDDGNMVSVGIRSAKTYARARSQMDPAAALRMVLIIVDR